MFSEQPSADNKLAPKNKEVKPVPFPSPEIPPNAAEQRPQRLLTGDQLSPENKINYGKLWGKAKEFASRLYAEAGEYVGKNAIVGKLRIAYHQHWIDRDQEKSAKYKGQMDAIDVKVGAIDSAKKEIEAAIEQLRNDGVTGAGSMSIKLQELNRQREALMGDKDLVQTKFERWDNKVKLRVNERDRIAKKVIGAYDEKLRPMESELSQLGVLSKDLDSLTRTTETAHVALKKRLQELEQKRQRIVANYKVIGRSDRSIARDEVVLMIDKAIADGNAQIDRDKDGLAKRRGEINKKIAVANEAAAPYKDKRRVFVRITERRPLDMGVKPREKGKPFGSEETMHSDTAPEPAAPEVNSRPEQYLETMSTKDFIESWNRFLSEKGAVNSSPSTIHEQDFLRLSGLSGGYDVMVTFGDLKIALEKYLEYKNLPLSIFRPLIEEFYNTKIKF